MGGLAGDEIRRIDALLHLVGGWRGGTAIDETPEEDWEFLRSTCSSDTLRNASRRIPAAAA